MKIYIFLIFLTISFTGCKNKNSHEILVSSAMSMKGAMEKLGKLYEEKNPGDKVIFNFGSSGKLAIQIKSGAPSDVYASASEKEMDLLNKQGFIIANSSKYFAKNSIVLIESSKSSQKIKKPEDLLNIQGKIALGNPKIVPAGRYAKEILIHYNLWKKLKGKMVFGETVRQVLDYVVRNEVDAGFVFYTDYKLKKSHLIKSIAFPKGISSPINYMIGVVKGTKNETSSRKFIKLLSSPEGTRILKDFGLHR